MHSCADYHLYIQSALLVQVNSKTGELQREKKFCALPLWHEPLGALDDMREHGVDHGYISTDGCLFAGCQCVVSLSCVTIRPSCAKVPAHSDL